MPDSHLPCAHHPAPVPDQLASPTARFTAERQDRSLGWVAKAPSALVSVGASSSSTTKYLPLLPKPTPPLPTRPNSPLIRRRNALTKPQRRCRVEICQLRHCTLHSHRHPAPLRTLQSTAAHTADDSSQTSEQSSSPPSTPASSQWDVAPQRRPSRRPMLLTELGGLPSLPLDDPDDYRFQELFHDFFSFQYDRIVRLMFPPPQTAAGQQSLEDAKSSALKMALSQPVYCLNIIANAHFHSISRRGSQRPDRSTVVLHGELMKLLRSRLYDFAHHEISHLILVIHTLVMLDIAAGHLESLRLHRSAVEYLIRRHGGVHNVKTAVPTILALDRTISIFTNLPPIYTPPVACSVRKPRRTPPTYGSYLEAPSSMKLLGQSIHQYCLDTCQAIEILEWEGYTFNPHDPPLHGSPNIYYFFFLRECVVNEFVRLNVATADDKTIGRCVLLTTKIIEYITIMDNYIILLPVELAKKIKAIICDPSSNIDWSDHPSLITWILFTLAALPDYWSGHAWTIAQLRRQLEFKYGKRAWPADWCRLAMNTVRCFVWSETRLCTRFTRVCTEIQPATADHGSRLICDDEVDFKEL